MAGGPSGVERDVPEQKRLLDDLVSKPASAGKKDDAARGRGASNVDKRARVWRAVKTWSKRLAITAAVLLVAAVMGGWLLIRHYEAGLPSVAELEKGYRPSQVTRVLARDGTTLAEIFTERRTVVKIEDLPRHV